MGELALIEGIRSGWAAQARGVALGIGDDCAILRPPRGHEILVTTDFTLEGRHFRRDWHPAESVGHRALARGLSDLAAMGARPLAAFLSLALPAEQLATRSGRAWVERFFAGLRALAELHHVSLAGGDTAQAPGEQILADIVLVGTAPAGRALRRSTAHAGDALYVTGQLGGAAAELAAMQVRAEQARAAESKSGASSLPRSLRKGWESSPELLAAHPQMFPQPRLAVGQTLLRRRLASSAIDLSDGLSTDLAHLCQESGVGAEVNASALPIHPLAAQSSEEQALKRALNGGEDYELLFAAPSAVRVPRSIAGVRVTRIGTLLREKTILLVDSAGRRTPLKPGGWEHFAVKNSPRRS
ncbi:MAG: thiamine-phosphate kinase [Acidobacteriaceae bacterium]|nr:thiamine-phosphate kinase [Acidobacteriaceae bacterium]